MPSIDVVLLSILLGYLLGSIPVAAMITRRRQLDIFSIGTGLPGAANVFRNVGHRAGALVTAGDAAKGALAIAVASRLGIEGVWILLPGVAAIAGHWRSIFTGFRGGDGVATLLGISLVAMPTYGLVAFGVAFLVGLWLLWLHRAPHPSLWSGIAGYGVLLSLSLFSGIDIMLALGIVTLALMVLAHAIIGHRRRRSNQELLEFPKPGDGV